jgi:hypothetical protein
MERMSVFKTYIPKADEISQEWFLADAENQKPGRLATQIASVLLGKNKTRFHSRYEHWWICRGYQLRKGTGDW